MFLFSLATRGRYPPPPVVLSGGGVRTPPPSLAETLHYSGCPVREYFVEKSVLRKAMQFWPFVIQI